MKSNEKRKNLFSAIGGIFAGAVNGLLGAGGGIMLIPFLQKGNSDARICHATSVAVMLPLSILSLIFYAGSSENSLNIAQALRYIPGGVLGAVCGAKLLPRISSPLLQKIFGFFLLWAAVRMLGIFH